MDLRSKMGITVVMVTCYGLQMGVKQRWTDCYPDDGKRNRCRQHYRWEYSIKLTARPKWRRVSKDREQWKYPESYAKWQTVFREIKNTSKNCHLLTQFIEFTIYLYGEASYQYHFVTGILEFLNIFCCRRGELPALWSQFDHRHLGRGSGQIQVRWAREHIL